MVNYISVITMLTLIFKLKKDDEITALNYALVYMANDEGIEKATKEWEGFKRYKFGEL